MKNGFLRKASAAQPVRGVQYKIIGATTTPEYSVFGDEVTAHYDVLTKVSIAGRRAAAHVDETFRHPPPTTARSTTSGCGSARSCTRARFQTWLAADPSTLTPRSATSPPSGCHA